MASLILNPGNRVDGPIPGTSTDNAIVRWDGATGRLAKNSVLVVADTTGNISGFGSGAGLTLHGGGTITGATGNIGIGTVSPAAVLHIDKAVTGGVGGLLFIKNSSTSAVGNKAVLAFGTDTGGSPTNNPRIEAVSVDAGTGASDFAFWTHEGGGIVTEQMRITNSGKVLLGTTTNSANGRIQLADHTTSAGGIGFGADTSLHRSAPGALQIKGLAGDASLHFGSTVGNDIGSISTSGSNLIVRVNNMDVMTWSSAQSVTFNGVVGVATGTDTTTALNTPAATAGRASVRVPHGVAPTTPVNGDLWTTTAGLFARINGVTVGPLS